MEGAVNRIDKLLQAAAKLGIPKEEADLLANAGKIQDVLRTSLTREAVKAALINGAWQSAALTAVFDIKCLFDGHVQQYLLNIGIGGLQGGAVSGLSSWINHPLLGNDIVLGVLVGSAVGVVSLASTGDWARFGKGLGNNVVDGASAWAGATAGSLMGAWLGPVGATVGAVLGGIGGGIGGRFVASYIPGLGGLTDRDVKTMYDGIMSRLSPAGVEPDPTLSPRQVVEAIVAQGSSGERPPFNVRMTDAMASDAIDLRTAVLDLREAHPEAFEAFLENLRAVSRKS